MTGVKGVLSLKSGRDEEAGVIQTVRRGLHIRGRS